SFLSLTRTRSTATGLLLFAAGEIWTLTSSLLLPEAPGTLVRTAFGTFGHAVKSSTTAITPSVRRSDRPNERVFSMTRLKLQNGRRYQKGSGRMTFTKGGNASAL